MLQFPDLTNYVQPAYIIKKITKDEKKNKREGIIWFIISSIIGVIGILGKNEFIGFSAIFFFYLLLLVFLVVKNIVQQNLSQKKSKKTI